MSRTTDLLLAVVVVVAFGAVAVWGHADARFAGVDATVADTTCTNGDVSALALRVTNDRDAPVSFALAIRSRQFTDPTFWRTGTGSVRARVPASTSERVEFAAPDPSRRIDLYAFDYGTPRNRTRTVLTLHDGANGRLALRGRLSCDGFSSFASG